MTTFNPGRCFVPRLGAKCKAGKMWCILEFLSRIFFSRSFCTLCTAMGGIKSKPVQTHLVSSVSSHFFDMIHPLKSWWTLCSNHAEGFVGWKQDTIYSYMFIAHSMRFLRCTYGNQIPTIFISLIQLNPAGVSKPTCQTPVQMQALLISHHSPSSPGHTTKMVWYVSEYDFLNGLMSIHFRKKKGASRCWDTPTEKERNRMKIMETEPKKKNTYSHS